MLTVKQASAKEKKKHLTFLEVCHQIVTITDLAVNFNEINQIWVSVVQFVVESVDSLHVTFNNCQLLPCHQTRNDIPCCLPSTVPGTGHQVSKHVPWYDSSLVLEDLDLCLVLTFF